MARLALGLLPAAVMAQPAAPSPAAAALPPAVESFFRLPQLHAVKLSPSGRQLAAMAGINDRRVGLFVFDLQQSNKVTRAAQYADADIRSFQWVNEQRLVYEVIDRRSGGGDQPFAWGLFSVRPDGSEARQLVQLDNPLLSGPRPIGREPLAWNHVLLHVPRLRLNVADGRSSSLAHGAPEFAERWWFDDRGEPRVVLTRHQGRAAVYRRTGPPGEPGPWQRVSEADAESLPWTPAFLDNEGELLVRHNVGPRGESVISRLDAATGRPQAPPFISTPGFDAQPQLVRDGDDGRLVGVRVETDAVSTAWFEPAMKAFQAEADRRLPGRVNLIDCSRCGSETMVALVTSYSDREPGQVLLYRQADRKWTPVGRMHAEIDARQMAEVEFHRIRTRDGREMPVWLTVPRRADPKKPLPTVVMVHGGPWVRGGHWHWDPMDQFLASRGYLVVSPEFRGSTGYGAAHYRAGWRQWGRAMQDDVADALLWASAQGYADRERVCIAGASYGGYATLMGLIRHPELYRCGVAWAAVTDPLLIFKWRWGTDQGDEVRQHMYPRLVGDPVADAAMLTEVSPLAQDERLKAPLLLAFGGEDRRVPIVHGTRLRDALKAQGREPEWIVYPEEGHGWLKVDNQVDFARRFESFLQKHLR